MGTLGELEFPQPWTGLQGQAGGKDKSCEGPGPSLDSGFFEVNKRLLFILKALVCVDGGETPSFLPQSAGLCVAHSPHRCVLGNKANGKEQSIPGDSPRSAPVFVTLKDLSSVSHAMCSRPDLLSRAGELGIHVSWTSPSSTTPTRGRDPV